MKQLNINLFAVIFSMIWIFNSFGEEKAFYYYQNEKIHIEPQRDKIIIYAGKTKTPIDEILRKKDIRLDQLCITREISENDSVFIISSSAQLIESMIDIINSDNEFEYISPVYLTDEGKELGLKNELLIKFKDGTSDIEKEKLLNSNQMKLIKIGFCHLVKLPKTLNSLKICNSLYNNDIIDDICPNFTFYLDYHTNDEWYNQQFQLPIIDATSAWATTFGSSSIRIALIDDGVEARNPDIPSNKLDIIPGCNVGSGNPDDPSPQGNNSHGQSCAGLIIAQHNDYGIAGIAPGCTIMPVRLDNYLSTSQVINALYFAYMQGAAMYSCSWGTYSSDLITSLVTNIAAYSRNGLGSVLVFSSGNQPYPAIVEYPARLSHTINGVISVTATNRYDFKATYTPENRYQITIAAPSSEYFAPGEIWQGEVWTTDIYGMGGYNPYYDQDNNLVWLPYAGYDYTAFTGKFGGTSAACPLAAGVVALIMSFRPDLTNAQIIESICYGAEKVGGYTYHNGFAYGSKSDQLGYGRINADLALDYAAGLGKIAVKGIKDNSESVILAITPNPANPFTTIQYTLAKPGNVSLDIYSVSGQKVATLVDGAMTAGTHSAVFDGSSLASGIYLYRFRTAGFAKTGKIALVK